MLKRVVMVQALFIIFQKYQDILERFSWMFYFDAMLDRCYLVFSGILEKLVEL